MQLEECREIIDAVDGEIMVLLNRRAEVSRTIGLIKARAGLPIVDWNREAEVLRRAARESSGDLADESAARIYRRILQESRQIQVDAFAEVSRESEVCK